MNPFCKNNSGEQMRAPDDPAPVPEEDVQHIQQHWGQFYSYFNILPREERTNNPDYPEFRFATSMNPDRHLHVVLSTDGYYVLDDLGVTCDDGSVQTLTGQQYEQIEQLFSAVDGPSTFTQMMLFAASQKLAQATNDEYDRADAESSGEQQTFVDPNDFDALRSMLPTSPTRGKQKRPVSAGNSEDGYQ